MVADLLLEALPEKKKYISCLPEKIGFEKRKIGNFPNFSVFKGSSANRFTCKGVYVELSLIFLVNGR